MKYILPLLALGTSQVLAAINWDIFEHGVVPTFKWSRPFPDDGSDPGGFTVNCKAQKTFHAKMYKLFDLPAQPPAGLAPWHDAIEDWMSKLGHYMGSWDGVDHKEQNRELVMMEWKDVPKEVRHWIEEQQRDEDPKNKKKYYFGVFEKPKEEGQRIFGTVKPVTLAVPTQGSSAAEVASVQEGGEVKPKPTESVEPVREIKDEDKIVVFPGAAVYEIMPLWVAAGSGACERELNNITKFKPQAADHCTIAWVTDHTKPMRDLGKRDIQFTIEAMAVNETEEGKYTRLMWEKMYRNVRRNERKRQREERERAKREIGQGITRDEL
ncbi:hypothetical protein QBC38DRAFT_52188 [Podospora fimiseda]|uniref:Uncharacterized protein n=1 Tax=Podospora fimiseda TaxID=252190 RepID=A0AAN7BHN3_9PEZI|nr:hypothetical protein QBC38DRAFT_52188 [Podospora fimiseda]